MKNQLTVFPAIFTYDGKYYNVDFIDLKGCSTFGNSIQEAYAMAQDAMGLYLNNMTDFPKTSLDFSNIHLEKNQFIPFISIDMDEYRKNSIINPSKKLYQYLNG